MALAAGRGVVPDAALFFELGVWETLPLVVAPFHQGPPKEDDVCEHCTLFQTMQTLSSAILDSSLPAGGSMQGDARDTNPPRCTRFVPRPPRR